MNEGGVSARNLLRACILVSGFLLTRVLNRFGLFRYRPIRRCYFVIYSVGKKVTDGSKIKVLQQCVGPGSVVVDIGSAFGFYAMQASLIVGAEGTVIAVEPDPGLRRFLQDLQQEHEHTNISVLSLAAWSRWEELSLNLCLENPGENSLFDSPVHSKIVSVGAAPLDEVLDADLVVDFVKIDVQGAETRALMGMKKILARSPRVRLLVECSDADLELAGSSTAELLAILQELHFDSYRTDSWQLVRSEEDLIDLRLERLGQCDLFCTRDAPPSLS